MYYRRSSGRLVGSRGHCAYLIVGVAIVCSLIIIKQMSGFRFE